MQIVADSSVLLAVALNEPEKPRLIAATTGHALLAPPILPFEIGNALSAMVRREVLSAAQAMMAWDVAQRISVALRDIDVRAALDIATRFRVYAYDAYFLECALRWRCPLLTLDRGMQRIAAQLSISLVE